MHRFGILFHAVLILLFIQAPQVNAQPAAQGPVQLTPLQAGTPIERTVAPGQVHAFTLNLEAGQFLQLVVQQRGIDVVIHIVGPDGKKLRDSDSPNGDDGPENVSLVAETGGQYTFVIKPLNQVSEIKPGRYEIRVLELRKATEQELQTLADKEAAKTKALALVKEAALGIPEIKSITTRVHVQIEAAGLLWGSDEKAASKLMADAVASLKQFIAGIDFNDLESMQNLQPATMLRFELIQALAPHDPETALSFLRATKPADTDPNIGYGPGGREDYLELSLANQIARKDPKLAFKIAEDNLKTRLTSNLFQTVLMLQNSDPELARKLAKDITTKILDEKLLRNREAMDLALALLGNRFPPRRRSTNENDAAASAIMSDEDRRELLRKTLNEALTTSTSISNGQMNERDTAYNALNVLKGMGPDLESQIPGSLVTVDKRLAEIEAAMDPQRASWQKFQQLTNNELPETAIESINKAPAEMRPQLFQQLADRTAATGDIARAKQIIKERVTNPWQRQQSLINLEQNAIYQLISKGKIEEALRSLAVYRPAKARASIIAQIAGNIGPGYKRATALSLLEQARSLVSASPQAEDQEQMNALLELVGAFSRYDAERAFAIVEPLVDQFNELAEAGRKLNGFFGQEIYNDGELMMHNGNLVVTVANQVIKALAALGTSNFEKAKSTADRLQPPEVKMIARLGIARQVIQPGR